MKTANIKLFFVAVILSSTLAGCFGVNREFRAIRNNILENFDGNFKKEIEFGIGPVGIGLASSIVSLSDADDYVDDLIRQVSSIQIGVWENKTRYGENNIRTTLLKDLSEAMYKNGWDYIVRTVDRDEIAMVFVKSDYGETIEELFVIALNDDELVIAELHGDLSEAVGIAIRENGLRMHMAKN